MPLARPTSASQRICAALDLPDPESAAALARQLLGKVGMFKVGLELFVAHGPVALRAVEKLTESANIATPIFLDLKLHDIPQTVESAARGAGALGASLVTVHASGGAEMVAAAKRGLSAGAASAGRAAPRLLAVTVLTSLSGSELEQVGFRGEPSEAALRLGKLAVGAGADGLVCSPHEVAAMRGALGAGPLLVVPGVRPAGAAKGDQKRVGTPRDTVAAGADWLVIGRPLRDAEDPGAAAEAIAAEIAG